MKKFLVFAGIIFCTGLYAQTTYTITDSLVTQKLDICKENALPISKFADGKALITVRTSDEYLTITLFDYNQRGVIVSKKGIVFTRKDTGWVTEAPFSGQSEFRVLEEEIRKRL